MGTEYLQRGSDTPLHQQLKNKLLERLERGEWTPGDLLPSEHDLCRKYGVSRITVRAALSALVNEGFLYRVQGKGTYVAQKKLERNLYNFYSFSRFIRDHGLKSRSEILSFEIVPPSEEEMGPLELSEGDKIYRIHRVRYADDTPFQIDLSHLPFTLCSPLYKEDLQERSLYDILTEKHGIELARVRESLEPVVLGPSEARLLGTRSGFPAFLAKRITISKEGRPVEYTRSTIRGDIYTFTVELSPSEVSYSRNLVAKEHTPYGR